MMKAEQQGAVLLLTINRPEALNALNRAVLKALRDRLEQAEENDQIKVIVITGEGDKSFAAGADITEFAHLELEEEGRQYAQYGKETFDLIEGFSKPVIAAVNGYALGGGLELALACDIRLSSTRAKFGFPEISLGILPGFGGAARASRTLGKGAAMNLMMLGETISAEDARQQGLVDRLIPQESFMKDVMDYAGRIAAHSSGSLAAIKESVIKGDSATETGHFGELVISPDVKSKISAFLEKRRSK